VIKTVDLTIKGQLRSGKNNMIVTRSGHHVPKPKWAAWRNEVLAQIFQQRTHGPIDKKSSIWVRYFAGDRRRRDVPGMLDALYHCLERAKIVKDDSLLDHVVWTPGYDKSNPRVLVLIKERGEING